MTFLLNCQVNGAKYLTNQIELYPRFYEMAAIIIEIWILSQPKYYSVLEGCVIERDICPVYNLINGTN